MFRHLVYLYKVPRQPQRIGFVLSSREPFSQTSIPEQLLTLSETYELSIHRITTSKASIRSIIEKDPFFDSVTYYEDLNSFSTALTNVALPKENLGQG